MCEPFTTITTPQNVYKYYKVNGKVYAKIITRFNTFSTLRTLMKYDFKEYIQIEVCSDHI